MAQTASDAAYDSVELRGGRLYKIRLSQARQLSGDDGMVAVAKCYCRTHDVLTNAEAEQQSKPSFVFPVQFFADLENLIGRELEGRIYAASRDRRVRFFLDLREHAGFQLEQSDRSLHSPWYDENVLKD